MTTGCCHKYFNVDWAVVWQIAREEVPLLEAQAMHILRAEFPDLAKTYEPDAASDPEVEDEAPTLEVWPDWAHLNPGNRRSRVACGDAGNCSAVYEGLVGRAGRGWSCCVSVLGVVADVGGAGVSR